MVPPFGKLPIPFPYHSHKKLEVYGKPMGALWERGTIFWDPGNSLKSIGKYTSTMDPKRVCDFCIISRFFQGFKIWESGFNSTSSPAMCLLLMIWGPKAYLLTFGIFCMRLNQPADDCFCTCFIPISNSKISGLKSDLRQTYSHINEVTNDE